MRQRLIFLFFYISVGFFTSTLAQQKTFTNPILPHGADPYSTFHDGYYYYVNSAGRSLELRKTKNLANLASAEKTTIWKAPDNTKYSQNVWAPEIHFINGSWYVYFAADDGDNKNHRMYVIANASADPFRKSWEFKGKVAAPSDKWAIDANVFRYKKQMYMIWSGWEGDQNGEQDIFIAKMKNPYTISGERVKIASPTYAWERHWQGGPEVYVNEGPQSLQYKNDLFIVFSASGCWTNYYSLGLLRFKGGNLLKAKNWEKNAAPVFTQSTQNEVYGPGHNSFFTSPDGSETWILYHANDNPGDGCGGKRSPRMQPINWNADGSPNLGIPVSTREVLQIPAQN